MPLARTLLLDLDGTLLGANNFPVFLKFAMRMLGRFHKRSGSALAAMRTYWGIQRAVLNGDREHHLTNAMRVTLEAARQLEIPHEEAESLLHASVEEIFPTLKPHFFPIPGAREFVDWAHLRYRLILATAAVWKEPIIRLRLEWAGIDPARFQFITHSERMHATKPSLNYYEEILAQDGLDPATALMIGDDPRNDLPAVCVGIPVFLISTSGPSQALSLTAVPRGAKAPAWRGNWGALRGLLTPRD
jgi:FMN phosphatase YigB (HAD superfamily)